MSGFTEGDAQRALDAHDTAAPGRIPRMLAALSAGAARVVAERDKMKAALEDIAQAYIGDCPAAQDETSFARGHFNRLRNIALATLTPAEQPHD